MHLYFLFLIIPAVALMLELVVRVHFFRPWLELYRGFLDAAKHIFYLSVFFLSVQFLEIKALFFALFFLFFCQQTNQSFRFTKPSFLLIYFSGHFRGVSRRSSRSSMKTPFQKATCFSSVRFSKSLKSDAAGLPTALTRSKTSVFLNVQFNWRLL